MTPSKARTAEAMRASGDDCRVKQDAPTGESVAFQIVHTRFREKRGGMGRGGESKGGTKNISALYFSTTVDSESSYGPSPQIFSSGSSTTMLEASLTLKLPQLG